VLVFIELVLGSSNPDGGVRLVPRLGRGQDDSKFAKYWMPTVRRKYIEDLDASAISDSFYNFCEIVINEQSEVGRGQKDCLSALRLAHGDVVVCQRMLNTLLRDAATEHNLRWCPRSHLFFRVRFFLKACFSQVCGTHTQKKTAAPDDKLYTVI
jgi:hypothetical protein